MTDVRIRFEGDSKDAVRAAKDVDRSIGGIDETSTRTSSALRGLGVVALGALAGLAVVMKAGWDELAEGEKVAAQTGAALKSTGGIANVTADQIGDLATTLSNLSGIDDELIQKGENLLLTFKNVRNEVGEGNKVFDRATASALDLSVAGFGSVESASKMLGKALNDPIRGMTALSRAGITFSEEQKETIKQLVETGHTLEAQKIILAEVETQVGGSAKAYGDTLPGQLAKARNSFEEMAANLTVALLPAMQAFADIAIVVFGFLSEHQTTTQIIAATIATLAVAILALNVVQQAWAVGTAVVSAAQWLLNAALTANPIGIVVVAIAALVAALIIAWRESETFRAIVTGAFDAVRGAAEFVLDFFRTHWKTIAVLISGPFAPIAILATDAFGVRSALVGAFTAVKTFISNRIDDIVDFFVKLPGRLLTTLDALRENALAPFRAAFSAAKTFVGDQVDAVVGFFRGLPGRLLGFVSSIKDAAASIGKGIFDGVVGALKDFGTAVANIIKSPINAIIRAINAITIPGVSIKIRVPFGKDINFSTPEIDPIPDIGELARGGPAFANMAYLVGEKGPELFVPGMSGYVMPNDLLSRMGGDAAGGGVTNVVNVVVKADGFMVGSRGELAEQISSMIVSYLPAGHRVAAYESRV